MATNAWIFRETEPGAEGNVGGGQASRPGAHLWRSVKRSGAGAATGGFDLRVPAIMSLPDYPTPWIPAL
jgi:hypothetical protein